MLSDAGTVTDIEPPALERSVEFAIAGHPTANVKIDMSA